MLTGSGLPMVGDDDPQPLTEIAERVVLRPVRIDDWSDVRALHAMALSRFPGIDPQSPEAVRLREFVYSPEYVEDRRAEALTGGWIESQLVGTCGWKPADNNGASARISSLYVNPMFIRLGIGQLLVTDAERRAQQAGFRSFTSRVLPAAAGFFERLGYQVSSHGVLNLVPGLDIAIAFVRKDQASPALRSGADALDAAVAPVPDASVSLEDR
jgi:GNAT superfamily N-acetyltransferase